MRKRNLLWLLVIAAVAVGGLAWLQTTSATAVKTSSTQAKFDYIVNHDNSACFGMSAVMQMDDKDHIMGSCCGPMSMHRYEEQIEEVKKYSSIEKIPKDPYDISVDQAKDFIINFKTIKLSSEQQKVYDDAKEMSMEGGPCCCGSDELDESCWRWKVYGGLAKYMITEHDFNAEQIAEMWDVSDGCGGDEHAETHN